MSERKKERMDKSSTWWVNDERNLSQDKLDQRNLRLALGFGCCQGHQGSVDTKAASWKENCQKQKQWRISNASVDAICRTLPPKGAKYFFYNGWPKKVSFCSFEARKLRIFALCRESHEDSKMSKKWKTNIFNAKLQKNNEDVVLEL